MVFYSPLQCDMSSQSEPNFGWDVVLLIRALPTKESLSLNTHVKLAEYVAKSLGHEIGFDPERDLIMIYDHEKQKWQNDVKLHTTKKSIRRIFKQLVESMDEGKERENLTNIVEHASIPYRVATELKLVVDEVGQDEFDADPMLMGAQNGVIDLATGEFRPGKVEDLITRMAGVPHESKATCPLFEQVAYEIMGENMEMYEYLQMLMGYLCMGHNPDQIFVIMQGRGDNGKSLLLNIIEAMLGQYATPMALPTVVDNGRETVGDDLMSLIGFRIFVARELKTEQKLNAAKLKMVTGNDRVSARHLYGRFTPIRPRGVPIIVTNEIPEITDGSNGLWRRLRLMPFTYVVPENKKDTELEKKLLPELPGILNWSLRGLKKYQAGLFKEPKIMLDMKQHLRDERSPLELFLFSYYEKSSEVKVGSQELYQHYLKWINANAFGRYMSQKAFSNAVVNLGIERTRPKATMFGLKRKEVIGWNEDEMED